MYTMSYIRTTPINGYARELLTATQVHLEHCLELNSTVLFSPVFNGLSSTAATQIMHLEQCASYAMCLKHASLNGNLDIDSRNDAARASQVYVLEMQRIVGHLFDIDHAFWARYYDRHNKALRYDHVAVEVAGIHEAMHHYQRRYAAYLVPIDSLHYLTDQVERTSYELIVQSVSWLLAGYFTPDAQSGDKIKAYRNASRIAGSLDLPDYQTFISQLINKSI